MKPTTIDLNNIAITPILNSNPTEEIALLPRNGSKPTHFKLEDKMQLDSIASQLNLGQKAIAEIYILDYALRFLELEEICVFVPISNYDRNREVRDRLKMNWEGIFYLVPGSLWCYYSLTKEEYLNRGQFPL